MANDGNEAHVLKVTIFASDFLSHKKFNTIINNTFG